MGKRDKIRADQAVVSQGLAASRSRAQALILAGKVLADDQRIDKAGQMIASSAALRLKGKDHPWVSRGGLKLAHGLDHFKIDVAGAVVVDVGASTGGFCDVTLSGGAKKVYAVDVGHGQLDWKLRNDNRVVVMERTNARYLTRDDIADEIDLIVCDASFISLKTVLPGAMSLTAPRAHMLALIKPQFEVGKGEVGKKGVVRDPALHQQVIDDISDWLEDKDGWSVLGVIESPIKGPQGNKEFLIGGRYKRRE
jgi:23S rRNA (cytidine1920-2'-O)/16S rRNA (cytidine1409-2'-O)-methyltransferase